MTPNLSEHYRKRKPSAIRQAQITFSNRKDKDQVKVINLAIGNVSLPMHPAMQARLNSLGDPGSPFKSGIVKYTPSVGTNECQDTFLNIIRSEGIETDYLNCVVTDGGSQAMELMMLGVCGPNSANPILLLEPAYTNYIEFGKRLSIPIVTAKRTIDDSGQFNELDLEKISKIIDFETPQGLIVIPGDNPTGQFLKQELLIQLAYICVEKDIWFISDEAYRSLYYGGGEASSIWKISEEQVPGIRGRCISIESASKVWNACGLRIGSLVTDNEEFHIKALSEYTANLCANAIGQYIFGALASISAEKLCDWYKQQREYYANIMISLRENIVSALPGLVVTHPEAAIYLVADFRNLVSADFNISDFIHFCAAEGRVDIGGTPYTVLLAPMNGFYLDKNAGRTQARIAVVEPPGLMNKAPGILSELFKRYCKQSK